LLIFYSTCAVSCLFTQVDEEEDPASIEHFGISTVEIMSAGVIPIGLSRGGTVSIVSHGESGFLAPNKDAFVTYTVQLMQAGDKELQAMQDAARKAATFFSFNRFRTEFSSILSKGVELLPYRNFVQNRTAALRAATVTVPLVSKKVAAIVAPTCELMLEYAVRRAVSKLGPEWSLIVFHTKSNSGLVEHMLKNIRNAKFYGVDLASHDERGYNRLLKSPWFWKLLQAEHALILRPDYVILGGRLDEFLEYDFVGAPWPLESQLWPTLMENITLPREEIAGGGGGLSLRRVETMIAIAEESGHDSPDEEAEDVFFLRSLLLKGHKVAPRTVSHRFAQHLPCPDLAPVEPFGVSASLFMYKLDSYLGEGTTLPPSLASH
jgi:hypothetical protein